MAQQVAGQEIGGEDEEQVDAGPADAREFERGVRRAEKGVGAGLAEGVQLHDAENGDPAQDVDVPDPTAHVCPQLPIRGHCERET